MNLLNEFAILSKQRPEGLPPIEIVMPVFGRVGDLVPQKGIIYDNSAVRKQFEAFLTDNRKFEFYCLQKKLKDAVRLAQNLAALPLMVVTNWDEVLLNRSSGAGVDDVFYKSNYTTVANSWSHSFLVAGKPAAGTYAVVPTGSILDNESAGAMRVFPLPTGSADAYLLNFGVNHANGTNIVMLIDLMVAADNISANTTTATQVNTADIIRSYRGTLGTNWSDIQATLEVTTALGATASNVTVTYENQAGTGGRSSGAIAMTASAIVRRLQPVLNGPFLPLQSGDIGVKRINTVTFSAAMGAGVVAVLLYTPLLFMPTLSVTTYIERAVPNMLGGIRRLVKGSNGRVGCLSTLIFTSTTSPGVQTYSLTGVNG